MTCWSIRRRITDYVDGRLRGGELSRVESHLLQCLGCELRTDQFRSIRASLQQLSKVDAPSDLRTQLRVRASQERRTLLENDGSQLLRLWNSWRSRMDELMRPFTIPATGGFCSSLILFGALAITISTTTRGVTYEVPVMYAEHLDANLVPVELHSSVVLTISLDGNGRIIDYAVRDKSGSFVGDATRLQSNNIAMPEFPSVLALAQPITSDIRISFTPIVFRR